MCFSDKAYIIIYKKIVVPIPIAVAKGWSLVTAA